MRASEVTRCGVAVALLAVGAALTVPVGPVPLTLQTLVLTMLPVALGGRDAVVAVAVYLLMGAAGLPVFSGMTGGVGVLAGPTGGFLWGFLLGEVLAAALLRGGRRGAWEWVAAGGVLLVSYLAGTLQLIVALGTGPLAALASAVVPFVVPDVVKLLVGVSAGRRVRAALGGR